MDEKYISIEAAIAEIKADAGCANCYVKMPGCCLTCDTGRKIRRIEEISAADVQPIKQGEWMMVVNSIFNEERFVEWTCSECGYVHNRGWRHTNDGKNPNAKFCENCGAKMEDADK